MQEIIEEIQVADRMRKVELVEQIESLPATDFAAAVADLDSMGDQQEVVGAFLEKWSEDYPKQSPEDTASAHILALRDALLTKWEAEDRAELESMTVYRMSYLYSVGRLASFKRDGLFEQVQKVITERLLKSDVEADARGILARFFSVSN